jgi:hypothetical protein
MTGITQMDLTKTGLVFINPDEAGVLDLAIAGQTGLWADQADPKKSYEEWENAADRMDAIIETQIGPELRRRSAIMYIATKSPEFYFAEVFDTDKKERSFVVGILVRR